MVVKVCLVFFLSAYVLVAQGLPEEKDMHEQIRMLKEIVNKAMKVNRDVPIEAPSSTAAPTSSSTTSADNVNAPIEAYEATSSLSPDTEHIILEPLDFPMKIHSEEVIAKDYSSLTFSTFEHAKVEDVVKALEHLTQDFIHELSLYQNGTCIYSTELIGALAFILEDIISHDLHGHLVAYIDHAVLHLEPFDTSKCMTEIESKFPAEHLFGSLYDSFYSLLGDAEIVIDLHSPFFMSIRKTKDMIFRNIETFLLNQLTKDMPADKAVVHILSFIYRWLEAIKYTTDGYKEKDHSPNCTLLVTQLASTFEKGIEGMGKILISTSTINNFVDDALGTECASIAHIVKEDIHKNIKQWSLPIDLVRKVHMELKAHEQRHYVKPALQYTLIKFFDMVTKHAKQGAYFEGQVAIKLEQTTPVPLNTPMTSVYFEHLEEIMLVLVGEIEHHFASFCLDHKLLGSLIGLSAMRNLDFTTANLHMLNIVYRIWKELVTAYPDLNSSVRRDLNTKFDEIINQQYRKKLFTHINSMDMIVMGVPTETLFIDVSPIPEECGTHATLKQLLDKVVLAVVPLFYEVHNCSHDDQVYMKTVTQIHEFLNSVESGDMVTNSSIHDLLSVVPLTVSPAVINNITSIMKNGLNLQVPHLLEDYHLIAAEIDASPVEARHAIANFIAEKIAYILYSEIRKISFTPMPVPESLPAIDVNEGLKRIISWQHKTITSFFTKYMSGLQETMLNLGHSDIDICKVSPGMCSPETTRKRQLQTKIEG